MFSDLDIQKFFTAPSKIDDYLTFEYQLETNIDPKQAAAHICAEQSTAQWLFAGSNRDLRDVHGARVLQLSIDGIANEPLLPYTKKSGERYYRCKLKIAHPIINFGARIPNIMSAMAGEGAFYCPGVTTLRLTDISFPKSFTDKFQGPQFGVSDLRKLFKVDNRPFFIGVVKPNIGLTPDEFAKISYEAWMGGLDIAKDDEMLADADYSSLTDRMQKSSELRKKSEKETLQPKGLLANITDEVSEIESLYEQAKAAGANMVMINVHFAGISSVRMIRRKSTLPIVGHFTGQALYDRNPYFGIDPRVLIKIQRLAGCDIIIMPGFGERMHASDETVLSSVAACLEPMGNIAPALPVPGGSDWAGTLPVIYQKLGHTNFGFIAGRGIFGHPNGPKAGAQSLHQAWEAIQKNVLLEEYATTHQELQKALDYFG